MKRYYPIFFLILLVPFAIFAQEDSSIARKDSLIRDSVNHKSAQKEPVNSSFAGDSLTPAKDGIYLSDSLDGADSLRLLFANDSIAKLQVQQKTAVDSKKDGIIKIFSGKEDLFYYLVFLLLLFGLLRRAFPKYFSDLFRVFFRTTLKQKQVREQMLQTPLPSVFMNTFFILIMGLYINFLLRYFQISLTNNFWLQYLWCAGGLASIYILKFVGLKIAGWMFNVSDAADSYIFVVFIINKIVGIFLLPILIIMAFGNQGLYEAVQVLSWVGIGILLLYRLILSYGAIHNEVKLNSFHFLLYILGFEVIPLLLIYKLLLIIF